MPVDMTHFFEMNSPMEFEEHDILELTDVALAARVVLFNDEIHTYDEVTSQIRKATNCSLHQAEILTIEVDTMGKAVVFTGDMPSCLKVSTILEEIELHTQIEC